MYFLRKRKYVKGHFDCCYSNIFLVHELCLSATNNLFSYTSVDFHRLCHLWICCMAHIRTRLKHYMLLIIIVLLHWRYKILSIAFSFFKLKTYMRVFEQCEGIVWLVGAITLHVIYTNAKVKAFTS